MRLLVTVTVLYLVTSSVYTLYPNINHNHNPEDDPGYGCICPLRACNPNYCPIPDYCGGGIVKDPCGCCDVCAKVKGENCQCTSECARGLKCVTSWHTGRSRTCQPGQPAPFLTVTPAKSEFTAGEGAKLMCSCGSPNHAQSIRFFLNDVMIVNSSSSVIWQNNLKPLDSGSYTCDCVLDASTTPKSNVVSFTVVEPKNKQEYDYVNHQGSHHVSTNHSSSTKWNSTIIRNTARTNGHARPYPTYDRRPHPTYDPSPYSAYRGSSTTCSFGGKVLNDGESSKGIIFYRCIKCTCRRGTCEYDWFAQC